MDRGRRGMNLVLVGFMASGKTAVGRRVARRLGYRFMDTDQYIETEMGTTISEIFDRSGEEYFRDLETKLLRRLRRFDNYIFATGGGILTTPGNMELLKEVGTVVFLNADPEDILKRLEHDTRRPKVQGGEMRERVQRLLGERMALYMQSDVVIKTLGKTPNQVAGDVIRRIASFHPKNAPHSEEDKTENSPEPETDADSSP